MTPGEYILIGLSLSIALTAFMIKYIFGKLKQLERTQEDDRMEWWGKLGGRTVRDSLEAVRLLQDQFDAK